MSAEGQGLSKRLVVEHSNRWARSANVNNANNSRNVTSTGGNNNNNAYNGNYFAPDCSCGDTEASRSSLDTVGETRADVSLIERNCHPVAFRFGQVQTEATDAKASVCKLTSLLEAEHRCHRLVGYKNSVSRFHQLVLSSCYRLHKEMMNDEYRTKYGDEFEIFEPKYRIVTTTHYRDRIPQASFILNWWYPNVVPYLIENNHACMKGRGVDNARNAFRDMVRSSTRSDYCLCADMKSYFGTINHEKLSEVVDPMLGNKWASWYFSDVINCNGQDAGIGLGSEIDQLSATTFPNDLDHKLERLGKYVRYMDDFRFIGTLEKCKEALEIIRTWAGEMKLMISEKKTFIQRLDRPIAFLGFTYLKHETGKVTAKRIRSKTNREKRKLRKMKEKGVPLERVADHYQCVRAVYKKGTRSQMVRLDRYYNNLFKRA